MRRGLDAVGAAAQIHLVAVEGKNLPFRIPLLDLKSDERLVDLPCPELLGAKWRRPVERHLPGQLLGQRAGAASALSQDVLDERDGRPPQVDPKMAKEGGVLRGDDRVPEHLRDVVVADDDPPLGRKLGDLFATGRIHPCDGVWRVVVQGCHLCAVWGVGEHHTADTTGERRHDQQEDAFGLFDEWVGGSCHGASFGHILAASMPRASKLLANATPSDSCEQVAVGGGSPAAVDRRCIPGLTALDHFI